MKYNLSTAITSAIGSGSSWWNVATHKTNSNYWEQHLYIGTGDPADGNSAPSGTSRYRARIYFTIPSSLKFVGETTLTIKLKPVSNYGTLSIKQLRGHLSTVNAPDSNSKYIVGSAATDADILATGYLYTSATGTT
jgi:hypothetical protein